MKKAMIALSAGVLFAAVGLMWTPLTGGAVVSKKAVVSKPRPGGSRGNCTSTTGTCNDVHNVAVVYQGMEYPTEFTGGMYLECIDTGTTTTGLWWWKQMVRTFEGVGTNPTLGTAHVYLDSSRTQTQSYMECVSPGVDWPRKHDVYAYAKLTLSSIPGKVFRSRNQFHMYNNAITSFHQVGSPQTYDVSDDVEFEDPSSPNVTVIKVLKSPTTVYP